MNLKQLLKKIIYFITTFLQRKELLTLERVEHGTTLHVPYYAARPGNCGIACVAMVIEFSRKIKLNVPELAKKYRTDTYYNQKIGWLHSGLVDVCNDYGVQAFAAENQYLLDLIASLKNNRPVIVSLHVPEPGNSSQKYLYKPINSNEKKTGHLCLLVGVTQKEFVIHDPRNMLKYTKNVQVPFKTFVKIFTGRCIYLK